MSSGVTSIKKALFARLGAISALTSLVTGIFDLNGAPETQDFPFVTLGETTESRYIDSFGRRGWMITIMLHIWSIKGGDKEATSIHNLIYTSLDNQDYSLDSTTRLVSCQYDSGNVMADDSTQVKLIHRIDRYRFITEEM